MDRSLPVTGAEIFEASEGEVVGRVALVSDEESLDPEAIRAEQESFAVALKPSGGATDSAATKAMLEEAAALIPEREEVDLLESEYESLVGLLGEIYERLDGGTVTPDSLVYYEEPTAFDGESGEGTGWVFGAIDHGAEEFLCVSEAVLHGEGLARASDFLGLSIDDLTVLVACVEGREWLLTGEDPTDWPGPSPPEEADPEAVEAEVEELASMWETPEYVDENELKEATQFGRRGKDGQWIG